MSGHDAPRRAEGAQAAHTAPAPAPDATPRVSVVVASYEHEAYVTECLESVLAQTYQDFEIVVTDDGSRDGTAGRIRAIDDPRIRLEVLPQNRGACIAMNHAIARARGEFVAVLNSDDLFVPDKLAEQVAFLDAHPDIAAVFGWPEFVDERGQPFDDETHKDWSVFRVENRDRFRWLRHFFDHGNCLCHPTLMIRRRCYRVVGGYDARMAQVPDLDMWVRLAARYELHVMPRVLTRFRIRDGQRNASAARPEVVRRDAWERQRVLEQYLAMPAEVLRKAFPEYADDRRAPGAWLAEHALGIDLPFHVAFGLETAFASLPPGGDGPEYARLIALTGRHDVFGIHRRAS